MNIEELRQQFLQAYDAHHVIRYQDTPDRPQKNLYKIFFLLSLGDLAKEIQKRALPDKKYDQSNEDFSHNYGARFIVDKGKTIKFSREGARCPYIPAHSDIESQVLTAGNIHFSEDYTQIVGISNKSGHFRPDFSTLVFAIPLILSSSFPLAERIELKNEQTRESIMLDRAELMDLLPQELLANINNMMEVNQSEEPYEDENNKHKSSCLRAISSFPTFFEGFLDLSDEHQLKRPRLGP